MRRNPHEVIGLWLEEGPVVVPADRRSRMLGEILVTPQPRGWRIRFRATAAIPPINLGIGAAVVVVVVAGAIGINPSLPDIVGPLAAPSPSTSVGPVASGDSSCEAADAAAPNQAPSTAQTTSGPYPSTGGRSREPGPLPAGTIEMEALDPPISLRLGSGWWMDDYGDAAPPGRVAIEHPLEAGGFVRIGFWDTADLTVTHPTTRQEVSAPSDFVRFLLEMESIGGCELTSLELGGMTANRVDFDWTSDWETWFIRPVEVAAIPASNFTPPNASIGSSPATDSFSSIGRLHRHPGQPLRCRRCDPRTTSCGTGRPQKSKRMGSWGGCSRP